MDTTSFRPAFALALLSLVLSSAATAQVAVNASSNDAQPALQEVVVTGSRIPTTAADVTPEVTVITSQQLEDRGFTNAFDALSNLTQNTGFTQGADFGNTFTPAASTISLRGLGPNHTLVLINGQRVADYPVPYNGAVNFVNLANIPSASIDRIEILNGGASAIYGSDAVAGVVNIILKDHAQGIDVDLKGGTTQHGGGGNARLQVSGGGTFGNLSTVFALEVSRVEPIWAEQRSFMTSTLLQGSTPPSIVWQRTDLTLGNNDAPPGGCAPFAGLYQNSTVLAMNSQDANGPYCGSGKVLPTDWTVQTGNQAENFYGSLKYALGSSTDLFGDVILGWNHIWNNTSGQSWTSDGATTGYFLNQGTGDYESWSRGFGPEEEGGVDRLNQYWDDFSGIFTTGIEGDIGASSWKYKGTYSGSVYADYNADPDLLSSINSYFLGPQLGTDSNGVAIYSPNTAAFNQPLSPSQFNSMMGTIRSTNNSWLQSVTLTANGKLFNLPAGPVGAAGDLEWGDQGFTEHPDPGINEGIYNFNGPVQDFPASGNRTRYAVAMEFNVPILSTLNADIAGRYDRYTFAGTSEGKPTFSASLNYNPIDMIRVHGDYATSFRAPDMNYIFQSESFGYEAETTDYYRCALANDPLSSCPYANMSPGVNYTQFGSHTLGFENGRSFDYGVVFQPIRRIQISADYWNMRIDNEVTLTDYDELLKIESDCLLGQLNPSSSQCVQAIADVQRNPANAVYQPDAITNINIYPINAAYERTDGMDFGLLLSWNLRGIGDFSWRSNFTMVMSHWFDQGQGSQPLDLVRSFLVPGGGSDFPNKLTSTLAWTLGNLSATVEADRYGQIINEAQTAWLTPTTLVNLSAQYKAGNATFMVIVDNVFDTEKMDPSFGWPFYAVGYYLPYGRQGWLEMNYHFGKSEGT